MRVSKSLYSVFDPYACQLFSEGLCEKEKEDDVGDGVKDHIGKGRQNGGKINFRLKSAHLPEHGPDIHHKGIKNARKKSVCIEQNAILLQRLCEDSRHEAENAPGKHLKGRPRTLPEIEIGNEGREGAREKSCLRAEEDARDDGDRRDGLEEGEKPAHNGKSDHNGNEDQSTGAGLLFVKAAEEENDGKNRHRARHEDVFLLIENEDAEKHGKGNQNGGDQHAEYAPQSLILDDDHAFLPFSAQRAMASFSVTAPS